MCFKHENVLFRQCHLMYVQYNIVHAWFEVQRKPINTWRKEYVFWIWSSIDVKSFVYFCRPILPLSSDLSPFLLLLLHMSCWGSQMRDHWECAMMLAQLCSMRKVLNYSQRWRDFHADNMQLKTVAAAHVFKSMFLKKKKKKSDPSVFYSATRKSSVEIHRP